MNSEHCFHCGLGNPKKPLTLIVDGKTTYFCCFGCKSAAQTIFDSGLGEYYRFYKPDQQPADTILSERQRQVFQSFDRDEYQKNFVEKGKDADRNAILIIDGISCSACTWLIEKRMQQLPGMKKASVNAGTHRLAMTWDNDTLKLSQIMAALFLIGYKASPFVAEEEERLRLKTQRQYIFRLGVAGIGMMQAMMNTVALYSGEINSTHEQWLWWTSLFLTVPVILISASPFFKSAWFSIKARQLNMDVSVSLALLSAFIASVYATFTGTGEVFYESVNMFTFFLVLSRFLEFRARSYAHIQGNKLVGLLPQTCQKISDNQTTEVMVSSLEIGDIILLQIGDVCPVDGQVVAGTSEFDESSFTGEFKGIKKAAGDTVLAGTTNHKQPIQIQVLKSGSENSYHLLNNLIERSSAEKPRLAQLADRGSRQFIWSTLIISFLIGLVWLWIDSGRAFWIVISVLVVTCPCALSLATPTAFAQATANLKNRGFIITRGYALDRLADLNAIAFDKTGTLTEGRFSVDAIARLSASAYSDEDLLQLCRALEAGSKHPIASAFNNHKGIDISEISNFQTKLGSGVEGTYQGQHWRLGSADYTHGLDSHAESGTFVFLTADNNAIAKIHLTDRIRSTASAMFSGLREKSITTHVLTGDSNLSPEQDLRVLGLTGQYQAGCKPEDKVIWLEQQHDQRIAVVGDGVNDAPLLARAFLSLAMLEATDLTKTQADILLVTNNLQVINEAISVARRTQRIIRQNLFWALAYNGIALPVAAFGLVSPWQAAIGMSLSSLIVVGNAFRLRK